MTQYLHLDEHVLTHHLRELAANSSLKARPRIYWRQEMTMSAAYQKALADDGNLWWRNGRTFDARGHELMYLHFHKLKGSMQSIDFGFDDRPGAFVINRQGILAAPGPGAARMLRWASFASQVRGAWTRRDVAPR